MKAADFMGLLFLARDVAHSVHLNTRSYAVHKATPPIPRRGTEALLGDKYEKYHGVAPIFGRKPIRSEIKF